MSFSNVNFYDNKNNLLSATSPFFDEKPKENNILDTYDTDMNDYGTENKYDENVSNSTVQQGGKTTQEEGNTIFQQNISQYGGDNDKTTVKEILMSACKSKLYSIIEHVIKVMNESGNNNYNYGDNKTRNTLLHYVVEYYNNFSEPEKILNIILNSKDIVYLLTSVNENGDTPLHIALRQQSDKAAEAIFGKIITVPDALKALQTINKQGRNILNEAVRNNKNILANKFVSFGCTKCPDNDGYCVTTDYDEYDDNENCDDNENKNDNDNIYYSDAPILSEGEQVQSIMKYILGNHLRGGGKKDIMLSQDFPSSLESEAAYNTDDFYNHIEPYKKSSLIGGTMKQLDNVVNQANSNERLINNMIGGTKKTHRVFGTRRMNLFSDHESVKLKISDIATTSEFDSNEGQLQISDKTSEENDSDRLYQNTIKKISRLIKIDDLKATKYYNKLKNKVSKQNPELGEHGLAEEIDKQATYSNLKNLNI